MDTIEMTKWIQNKEIYKEIFSRQSLKNSSATLGGSMEELIREIQLRFAMQRKEYYITHKAIIEIEVLDGVLMQKLKKYLANNGYYCYNINNTLIITKYRD